MKADSNLYSPELHCLYAAWYAAGGDRARVDEEVRLAAAAALHMAKARAQALTSADLIAHDRTQQS